METWMQEVIVEAICCIGPFLIIGAFAGICYAVDYFARKGKYLKQRAKRFKKAVTRAISEYRAEMKEMKEA